MEAELPWQQRIAYNMSILSSMKLKFDMVRDIPQLNKCTKISAHFDLKQRRNGTFLCCHGNHFSKNTS